MSEFVHFTPVVTLHVVQSTNKMPLACFLAWFNLAVGCQVLLAVVLLGNV